MKSWINSVWVKRFAPIGLVAVVWFGYRGWSKMHASAQADEIQRLSQAVAEVWIASATHRADPDKFVAYRDSLLKAKGLTLEDVESYIKSRESNDEAAYLFAQTVSRKVDSMYRIIDSTLKARPRPADTSKVKVTTHRAKPKGAIPRIQMPTDSAQDSLQ